MKVNRGQKVMKFDLWPKFGLHT